MVHNFDCRLGLTPETLKVGITVYPPVTRYLCGLMSRATPLSPSGDVAFTNGLRIWPGS